MNTPDSGRFRELVGRLSDGMLTPQEGAELNQLLKDDPIAQEMYLDHLFVDGLLERELVGTVAGPFPAGLPPRPARREARRSDTSRRLPRWLRSLAVGGVSLAIGAAVIGWMRPSEGAVGRPLPLTDSSFESGSLVASPTSLLASWYGDDADVVPDHLGVKPLEGNRMLRFVRSTTKPENSCDLYQIIDLQSIEKELAEGPAHIEASAAFNAAPETLQEGDCIFGVTVFAYSEDPSGKPHVWPLHSETPLTFSGNQTRADDDAESWQRVHTRLSLPAGSKFLIVQLSVMRSGDDEDHDQPTEFPGQFADGVSVRLLASDS